MDLTPYRRYLRWLKRVLFLLVAYIVVGFFFIGVTPKAALRHPGTTLSTYRGFVVYLIFIAFTGIIYFVAIFWFMARGNDYVIYPGEYETTFDDVRGQPAAVRSTKEVLRLFQGLKKFKDMGVTPPHGILFEGPPGTGKTLMAKAIASHTSVPFLYSTGSGFAAMFFGVGNMKVRRLFKKARTLSDKYGGAVIFIDEIDAVGSSRGGVSERSTPLAEPAADRIIPVGTGGGMYGGGMGILNELLVQMDGMVMPRGLWRHTKRLLHLGKPKVPFYNILIIAATNRASVLDPALLRPGRFDRKIHVGLPDHEGRQDIAKYYLAKVRHEPVDIEKLARMTVSYSPAMIQNIVNEALIFALQDGRDALRWDDLWNAKLVEEVGLKQPVNYTQREKEMVAIHEAAHAVASYSLERGERQIQVVTIQKREGALGLVHGQTVEDRYLATQREVLARIQVALAGLVAEEIWFGQTTSGPSSDLQAATFEASRYIGVFGMGKSLISATLDVEYGEHFINAVLSDRDRRKEVDNLLDTSRGQVRVLLQRKKHVVEGLRDALLEREELIGDEIEEVMAQLGEREPLGPIPVPVPQLSGNGQRGVEEEPEGVSKAPQRPDVAPGDGNGSPSPDD